MSSQSVDRADPNLTPLLDMVFQLITFFMLVINFKGASLDLSLKLPVVGSARPLDRTSKLEPIVLNVNADGSVTSFGQPIEIESFMAREVRQLQKHLRLSGADESGRPVTIVIRADRDTPFRMVNEVLRACQKQGYRTFSLNALLREER